MALKPLVKVKVDELFLRWLSNQEVKELLYENLNQIRTCLPPFHPEPRSGSSPNQGVKISLSSPKQHYSASPPPGKLISPRSPRRISSKNNNSATSSVSSADIEVNTKHDKLNGSPDLYHEDNFRPRSDPQPPTVNAVVDGKSWRNVSLNNTPFIDSSANNVSDNRSTNVITRKCDSNDFFPLTEISRSVNKIPSNRDYDSSSDKPISNHVGFDTETPRDSSNAVLDDRLNTRTLPNILSEKIPPFYFPLGQPVVICDIETILNSVSRVFAETIDGKIYMNEMSALTLACNLPLYWRMALFIGANGQSLGHITQTNFETLCHRIIKSCHDNATRFVCLLAKNNCGYLVSDDFVPVIQDIVDHHPGLRFLQEAPEFHTRYIKTVIARIFYTVNRTWSGRISVPELRMSNFLETLQLLEAEEDINQVTDYFSYEHFYVIYCKFWELDQDHDLYIDRNDLARHNNHAISSRMVDRIFSGAVSRTETLTEGRMSYPDFVWFLLAEEDKKHPRSIEYWFRCMDLDGDGVISMYEMEYFYDEQANKMEALGIDKLPFEDVLCQMLDLVKPKSPGRITLRDLKSCKLTNIFFDTFFNLNKFLEYEQRDPFANLRDLDLDNSCDMSDWERYAAEEYEILVAEEGNGYQDAQYDDDFEATDEDEELIQKEMIRLTQTAVSNVHLGVLAKSDDDIYDFNLNDINY